jgi:hypothetical protein
VHRAGVMLNLDALSSLRRYGARFPGAGLAAAQPGDRRRAPPPRGHRGARQQVRALASRSSPRPRSSRGARAAHRGAAPAHRLGVFELDLFLAPSTPSWQLAAALPGAGVRRRGRRLRRALPRRRVAHRPRRLGARRHRPHRRRRRRLRPPARLVLEPGRYVVCEAGVLVARVTTVKRTRDRVFVGVDSGMHHLIRPALYQSYHPVVTAWPRARAPPSGASSWAPSARAATCSPRTADDARARGGRPRGGGQRGRLRLRDGVALQPPR